MCSALVAVFAPATRAGLGSGLQGLGALFGEREVAKETRSELAEARHLN
jgi:hypothetical protein